MKLINPKVAKSHGHFQFSMFWSGFLNRLVGLTYLRAP